MLEKKTRSLLGAVYKERTGRDVSEEGARRLVDSLIYGHLIDIIDKMNLFDHPSIRKILKEPPKNPKMTKRKKTKIVISRSFRGFKPSQEACERLMELGVPFISVDDNRKDPYHQKYEDQIYVWEVSYKYRASELCLGNKYRIETRTDPRLIRVVESLGPKANGVDAQLEVIEVPLSLNEIEIEECNGIEVIAEKHRVWY